MTLADGITYNIRGLWLGLKTPKLLFWGLVRFFMVIAITIISATFILSYHQSGRRVCGYFLSCLPNSVQCYHHGPHVSHNRN